MKRSGSADLPLHYGHVPKWLAERMAKLGLAITESILTEYNKEEMLRRLSDPFWFQSLGAVMGMDWHSSGITTSVLGALKRAINPHAKQLAFISVAAKGTIQGPLLLSCCALPVKPVWMVRRWCVAVNSAPRWITPQFRMAFNFTCIILL
jgi:hypothetical protein